MSSTATAWVWANSPYKGTKRLIHLAVAEVVNHQNDYRFWMSNKNLAKECNCERTTVNAALKEFVADGYLEVLREATGRSKTVEYRFLRPESVGSTDPSELESVGSTGESVGSTDPSGPESVGSTNETGLKCPEIGHEPKEEQPKTETTTKEELKAKVQVVWEAYVRSREEHSGKKSSIVMDDKRKKHIENALGMGYSVDDLCLAVSGWRFSSWHNGEEGKVFNKLELLLRDSDKIEQFIGYHDVKKPASKTRVNDLHVDADHSSQSGIIEIGDDDEEDFFDD